MNWLARLRQKFASPTIAILPSTDVLFPDGQLKLTIRDPAWRQLIAGTQQPLGICLQQADGLQSIGTLAEIIEHSDNGEALQLCVQGGARFRLLHKGVPAEIEILSTPITALPERFHHLLPLLHQILAARGQISTPIKTNNAEWVGFRLCEALPISAFAKFKLFELDAPLQRLEILQRYLVSHKLLPDC